MKITNIRVKNNYKVKLTNSKLAGVNAGISVVAEQGTRTPVIPTPPTPSKTFQEKYDIVMKYLIERYEPGWSAGDVSVGKAATMALLGISAGINPLILGGTAQSAFQYVAYPGSVNPNDGWFDPLTHPKDFANEVKKAYKVFERARTPQKANHRFIDYVTWGIAPQTSSPGPAGNMFFASNLENQTWYPDDDSSPRTTLNCPTNYKNGIERMMLHSPYGHFSSPMNRVIGAESKRSYPWMNERYTGEGFMFDGYLALRESTTVRDLLNDHSVVRNPYLGVVIDGVTDAHLNTNFRDMFFPAGGYGELTGNTNPNEGYRYFDGNTYIGFTANEVLVGSPWIRYPNGVTWSDGWWGGAPPGLCFNTHTMVLFDGTTFPENPQEITDKPVYNNTIGISYGFGLRLLESLNDLSTVWGNSMEFIAYLGNIPYACNNDRHVPWSMFKDPTIAENVEYTRWRLDASVSHWKEKFRSPIDGFAHVFSDAMAIVDRTFHRFQPPGFTAYMNIASSGASYVENTPVSWARDQYNYTYGSSGPNPGKGVVLGTETFAHYMFVDDPSYDLSSKYTQQKKSSTDPLPRHWCLDEDIAPPLFTALYDLALGQRKRGFTYTNQIWGMGVCGSSKLGELFMCARPGPGATSRLLDAYPFFYNTFIQLNGDTSGLPPIEWKRISGTVFNDGNGVPWEYDRRFRLFYLYPTILALNGSVFDALHNGDAYYDASTSGWFDKTLGSIYQNNMEARRVGDIVDPTTNRRTPTTPPRNQWTGNARTSEFELLYACMKGGLTAGLDSLGFTNLYNELDSAGTTTTPREGYYRALDYAVYGVSYLGYTGDNPAIVPMIKPEGSALVYYRGNVDPGSTAGMPADQFEDFVSRAASIPLERRVVLPLYWLVDGPATFRPNDYFFKRTADGTTYTGNIPGVTYLSIEDGGTFTNLDTNPLRFNTPWAYVNRETAKTSYKKFLQQAKDVGQVFNSINDDSEALGFFQIGSAYTTLDAGTAALDAYANGNFSFHEIPDARRLGAIVDDPRFVGITNSVTNRTLAQEFKHHYDSILTSEGMGVCGASAAAILTFFTNVNNRNDFKAPWGNFEQLLKMYAWNAAIYTFCHGDLRSKIIGGSLEETSGFENTKKYSASLYATNAAEAKFAVDLYGHRAPQEHIPGYGHMVHSYGQLLGGKNALGVEPTGGGGPINAYGYPPQSTMEENIRFGKLLGWHPISEDGITFGCSAYQAFISDLRRFRGILRTRPQAYQEGIRAWIVGSLTGAFDGWSGDVTLTQFYEGNSYATEYYKEQFYHLCLNGVEAFHIFNPSGPVSLPNQLLIDWKVISGNTVGIPCTNATGATGATIDRIDLYEAARYGVISGAMTTDPTKRLWRITVPPECSTLVKTSTNQTDLPSTITIQGGSRGTWITAPASYGKPQYEPVGRYYFGLEPNKRMYAKLTIGENGSGAALGTTAIWNDVTDFFIATFKGTPMTGTRAYPWEANPANPTVSSPWHNVIYENCIDVYNWGSRAFYIYMPWGSFSEAFYLTPEIWRRTFTNQDGNTYAVPARWKGFTGAVKALLEGELAPSGKTAMTEPCNVMLYHGSNNGYAGYRSKSTALWDSFTGTTADKNAKYYEYLDSWTDQLISMKSSDPTKGRLSITLDASAPSADPSTLPLYRSTNNYRSDALELADWYIFNKLKDAGIDVYTEARPATKINSASEFGGTVGATFDTLWAKEASHNEEYVLWYANPANADPNIDIMQKDEDSPGFVRLLGSNFPIRVDGDPNRDPFQPKLNIKLSDGRGVTLDHIIHGVNAYSTPHYYAWQIYALSDNYRKYYNRSVGAEYFKGVKQKTENLIAYIPGRIAKCDVVLSVFDGVQNPLDKYWRLPTTIADSYKPRFDLTLFNNSVSGGGAGPIYGSLGTSSNGFWTQQGIDYLNNNVLQTSFSNFINFLHTYSENYAPPNSAGWTGNIYGTTADVLANNLIPIIPV